MINSLLLTRRRVVLNHSVLAVALNRLRTELIACAENAGLDLIQFCTFWHMR